MDSDRTGQVPASSAFEQPDIVHALAHCTGCGVCVPTCPTRALSLVSEQPRGRGRKMVAVAADRCTGCGNCLPACPRQALASIPQG